VYYHGNYHGGSQGLVYYHGYYHGGSQGLVYYRKKFKMLGASTCRTLNLMKPFVKCESFRKQSHGKLYTHLGIIHM